MNSRQSINLRRSELYQRVWETPMVKLARELGMSDVGLAKLCRRWDVPVPERGYWAKRRAGKWVSTQALPDPERDPTIAPSLHPREERSPTQPSDVQLVGPKSPLPGGSVVVADSLEHPHKLVRALQRYVEHLPRLIERYEARGGRRWSLPASRTPPPLTQWRYRFLVRGLLNVTASLDSMEWVLRLHDALFKALVAAGARIERREGTPGDWRTPREAPVVEVHFAGERAQLDFSQGTMRVTLDGDELARRRKLDPQAAASESRPSKRYTLRLQGTEAAARQTWTGTQERLVQNLEDIVRDILALVPGQAAMRADRQAAEEEARRRAQEVERERQRAQARAEQLEKAFKVAEADRRSSELLQYLDRLEKNCEGFREPYLARAKIWIEVVRHELSERGPVLTMLGECLKGRYWGEDAPDWWPTDVAWPKEQG